MSDAFGVRLDIGRVEYGVEHGVGHHVAADQGKADGKLAGGIGPHGELPALFGIKGDGVAGEESNHACVRFGRTAAGACVASASRGRGPACTVYARTAASG